MAVIVVPGLALAAALAPGAGAERAAQFPTTAREAIAVYESDVDDWLDGPVSRIALDGERDLWDRLETTAERQRFIQWFWDRRDEDLRDSANPFRSGFYRRVAEANQRFPGIPRGWRSDRGHVWIVLGRPNSMRSSRAAGGVDLTIWIYHTPGLSLSLTDVPTQLEVGFARTRRGWEVVGDFGAAGSFPLSLLSLFEQMAAATVVRPDLDPPGI